MKKWNHEALPLALLCVPCSVYLEFFDSAYAHLSLHFLKVWNKANFLFGISFSANYIAVSCRTMEKKSRQINQKIFWLTSMH